MAGAYKNRGPILNYSMAFLLILIIIPYVYFTILGWSTIGRGQPQIAWYLTGGLISFTILALTVFVGNFILGEYSPSIYRDPALYSFILNIGSVIPLVFLIWWYWDLGVRCEENNVKSIEVPMCSSGASGQVLIVWSMAAVSTLFGLFTLFVIFLSFADLYFRRLKTVTKATIETAKSVTPNFVKDNDPFRGAGEDISAKMKNTTINRLLPYDTTKRTVRSSKPRNKKR